MRILAPFSKAEEVAKLVKAGAQELYCGVVDSQWEKSYTYVSSINLRHDKIANLGSFNELREAVQSAHSMDAKVSLALNAHFYSQNQLPIVMGHAEKGVKAEADYLIVADAALVPKLKEEFPVKISLSTASHAFNNPALDFFKQLGVSRIVLPRHLTVEEIMELSSHAKKLGLTTECFVLNALCPYTDGLCTFQHIVDESVSFMPISKFACRAPFKATAFKNPGKEKKLAAESHVKLWNNTDYRDCGLCALPHFKRFGIDTVKIAGRGISLEERLANVTILKNATSLINGKGFKEAQFKKHCKERYFDLFHSKCDYIHCYYAGVGLE